jgi:hypothetical protein
MHCPRSVIVAVAFLLALPLVDNVAPAQEPGGEQLVDDMWTRFRRAQTERENLEILVLASPQKPRYTAAEARAVAQEGGRGVTHKRAVRHTRYAEDKKDMIHVLFSLPRDDAGTGFLVHRSPDGEDNQWLYLPALRKPRRVPVSSTQTFVGTNFIYEDIRQLSGERTNRYTYERLADEPLDGRPCHVVAATPKADTNSGYTRRKTWIDAETMYPMQVEYYDKAGKLWKLLRSVDVQALKDGVHRATLTEMRDLQLNETTLLLVTERKLGLDIPSEVFTRDYLQNPSGF